MEYEPPLERRSLLDVSLGRRAAAEMADYLREWRTQDAEIRRMSGNSFEYTLLLHLLEFLGHTQHTDVVDQEIVAATLPLAPCEVEWLKRMSGVMTEPHQVERVLIEHGLTGIADRVVEWIDASQLDGCAVGSPYYGQAAALESYLRLVADMEPWSRPE